MQSLKNSLFLMFVLLTSCAQLPRDVYYPDVPDDSLLVVHKEKKATVKKKKPIANFIEDNDKIIDVMKTDDDEINLYRVKQE